jgi:hypothetical protein
MHILTILALAQMPWTASLPTHGLSLDFLRPKFDGGQTSLTSAAAFLSGRFPAGGVSIKFELPYARLSNSGSSSATFGNPYVGVETGRPSDHIIFEGGFRFPATSEIEFASIMGFYSDVTRFEAFLPDVLTFAGRVRYRRADPSGLTVDAGLGPSIWVPIQSGSGDTEVVLHHHFSAGYRGPTAWMAFGVGGLLIATEEGSLAERTIYQLGASAGLSRGKVRPALHLIIPLDEDIKTDVDMVIGLGVALALP